MSDGPSNRFLTLAKAAGSAAVTVFLAACATPHTRPPEPSKREVDEAARYQLEARRTKQIATGPTSPYIGFPEPHRIANVNNRIAIAAASFCGPNIKTTYAISTGTPDNGRPVVMDNAAGIKPGSRILSVNGNAISAGELGRNQFLNISDNLARSKQTLQLQVQQGNQVLTAGLQPVTACNYRLQYHTATTDVGKTFNAFADGTMLHVTEKLVKTLKNDDDLGFVMAHEYIHNAYGHIEAKKKNLSWAALAGLAVDIFAATQGVKTGGNATKLAAMQGALAYSVDFEREADYGGLYVLKRAGYDLQAAQRVADTMAIIGKTDAVVTYSSTHPSTAIRSAAAEKTVTEIEHKHKHGHPLVPNTKNGPQ